MISPKKIMRDIKQVRKEIHYLYGEYEILDTPAGRILKALHEGGANLYVSSISDLDTLYEDSNNLLPINNLYLLVKSILLSM